MALRKVPESNKRLAHLRDADGYVDTESDGYRAAVAAWRDRPPAAATRAPPRETWAERRARRRGGRASDRRPGAATAVAAPTGPRRYPGSVPLTVRRTFRGIVVEEPPAATADRVASYLKALLTAPRVTPEVTAEREATCPACPYARWSLRQMAPWCSICGCKVGGATKYLLKKLTEVAENLPAWGCHHPERARGQGWKR